MKPGSASIERQEETQAPHWMQAIDWVMSIIDSGSTTYSRSGGSPWGRSQGVTRRILAQCVDSMSVIRSLITGMFPIGSMIIGATPSGGTAGVPGPASPGGADGRAGPRLHLAGGADGVLGFRRLGADRAARLGRGDPGRPGHLVRLLLGLADLGLAAEPGLAVDLHPAGAADRRPAGAADGQRAVLAVLCLQQPVEDRERGVEVDAELLPVGAFAALGLEPADFDRVLGH